MTLRSGLKAYFTGWKKLLGSAVYAALWPMIVSLPLWLLALLVPDHLEGRAPGSAAMQVGAVVVMLLWVPWVSFKLGTLAFRTDVQPAELARQTDPDIELLRGIIATQERLDARDGKYQKTN